MTNIIPKMLTNSLLKLENSMENISEIEIWKHGTKISSLLILTTTECENGVDTITNSIELPIENIDMVIDALIDIKHDVRRYNANKTEDNI